MKKSPLFYTPLFCAALLSCTSTKSYEASLEPWLGKTEKEMVMTWGIPDKQYQVDPHTKMVSYIKQDTAFYPGTSSSCFGAGGNYMLFSHCDGFPPSIQSYYCETLFTLIDGRIKRWGHKGNNCRS